MARAIMLVKRHRWFGASYDSVEKAAEELAYDAIDRTITGERKWEPAAVPDVEVFLAGVMRSIVSAAAKSPERRTDALSTFAGAASEDEGLPAEVAVGVIDGRAHMKTPEQHLGEAESVRELIDQALDAAGDDPNAEKVIEAAAAGCFKVDEFVEKTGLTTAQVYAATRKIRDRLRKGAKR
jgi:hypothetical protein